MNLLDNLNRLSGVKQDLFRALLKQYDIDFSQLPISHARQTRDIPLSYIQQSLFFLNQVSPDSVAYNVERAIRFKGQLDVSALSQAIDGVLQRHAILRAYCENRDGIVRQHIADFESREIEIVDLSDKAPSERDDSLMSQLLAESSRVFDLSKPPLFRTRLYRLDDDEHVLLIDMHHFVIDGLSEILLAKEITSIYQSIVSGDAARLPEIGIDYADFVPWERTRVDGGYLNQQIEFWKQYLDDVPALLELPTNRPRPRVENYRGQTLHFTLGEELTSGLRRLSEDLGSTLFITLLAVYQILLHRYSRQKTFVVATATSNRGRPELENLIGCFANNIVIKAEFSEDPEFADHVAAVTENALLAFANQDLPFEKLVEELHPERDLSRNPIFQVGFELHQESYIENFQIDGLEVSELILEKGTAMYDLDISMVSGSTRLSGAIEFNSDIFDREFVEQMQRHFENLLNQIVAHPRRQLSRLQLMPESERNQLLQDWSASSFESVAEKGCVHELIDQMAEVSPGSIAVSQGETSLTYRQLSEQSNQFANYLRDTGVRPGSNIGLCIDRRPSMLTALLGILKAGCTYVPLDANYPEQRLQYFIGKAELETVVSLDSLRGILEPCAVNIVAIDGQRGAWEAISADRPKVSISSDDVAYIIFTSGSTGNPKGVAIKHQSLTNYSEFCIDKYGIEPTDRAMQFSSLNFDTSIEEIFSTLCAGACLVLRDDETIASMNVFVEALQKLEISLLNLPTSYWHELVAFLEEGGALPESVRKVVIGGEKALVEKYRSWRKAVGRDIPLFNIYGPTEATVGSTYIDLSQLDEFDSGELPIGKPVTNALVYNLDEQLNPVPLGIPGELYIGGLGVASEYINDPGLTRKSFLSNPFSEKPGDRIYKTGDLVKFRQDGNIEYIGRADNQVKIRGFRIEIGEIESAMLRLDTVRQVVVKKLELSSGDSQLVAYLVSAGNTEFSAASVKNELLTLLPDYMVPQHIVELAEIPTTPNGKVDNEALPLPKDVAVRAVAMSARTSVEKCLARIWSDSLGIEEDVIDVNDDFFELGGHSLLAMRVISAIKNELNQQLSLKTLFERPSIRQLACLFEADVESAQEQYPSIEKRAEHDQAELSFAQSRLWFLEQIQPHSPQYNMPVFIKFTGEINATDLKQFMEELVAKHEILRTSFVNGNQGPLQVVNETAEIEVETIDFSGQPIQALHEYLSEIVLVPFDLENPPLFRIRAIKVSTNELVLGLLVHHIIFDEWSVQVLFREMHDFFRDRQNPANSRLNPLEIQYADYSVWNNRQLVEEQAFVAQQEFWMELLSGELPILSLPEQLPRPPEQSTDGDTLSLEIGAGDLGDFFNSLKVKGVTPFVFFLAAYYVLLSRHSDQQDVVIGVPIANRNNRQLEPLIGFFVNTLPLRIKTEDDLSFNDLLGQVKQLFLEAYENQDIPFEKLVSDLAPARDPSRTPVFQTFFNYINSEELHQFNDKLEAELLEVDVKTSKTDISATVTETGSGYRLTLEYCTALFKRSSMDKLLRRFKSLLDEIAENPNLKISEFSLLGSGEEQKLVYDWNQTDHDFDLTRSIPELFAEQVAAVPEATAVTCGEESLTYAKLERHANRLTNYLIVQGIKPGALVGVAVERSTDMVVAMLAILKAGACYIPIDPKYPRARVEYMFTHSQAGFCIVHGRTSKLDVFPQEVSIIDLDLHAPVIAGESDDPVSVQVSPDTLAYVIYTSGSTGMPKGVMVPMRAVSNFLQSMAIRPGMGRQDQSLAVTTLSFDISVLELFLPLVCGAQVVIAQQDDVIDGQKLVEMLEEHQISFMQATPATWKLMINTGWTGKRDLKALVGGEALGQSVCEALLQRVSSLWNMYGPTETTVWSSCAQITDEKDISIGSPIPNTRFFVLDSNRRVVPTGMYGELFIAGDGVTSGYLNSPDLTDERYLPNPWSDVESDKMYSTGDLVRYRDDGSLEYLSRVDNQIKLRGFRIELDEIGVAIESIEGVREQIVVLAGEGDNQMLVAYLVPDPGTQVVATSIRKELRKKLPDYMLPQHFVELDRLPLTPNGKIDRNALPSPHQVERGAKDRVAPRNDTEKQLMDIWAECLRLPADKISVYDNFFEIGGHSLLSIQVLTRVQREMGVKLSPRVIILGTLAQIADEIQDGAIAGSKRGGQMTAKNLPFSIKKLFSRQSQSKQF